MNSHNLSMEESKELSKLINNITGICLPMDKEYLIKRRLTPILKQFQCQNFSEFIQKLQNNPSIALQEALTDAMVTNETMFFRDQKPFDLLKRKILPDYFSEQSPPQNMSILSAGTSTGEEVYSLAILLNEFLEDSTINSFQITGIDVSLQVLDKAKQGRFSDFQVKRGLKPVYLRKYFNQEGENWTFDSNLKKKITFKRHSLLSSIPILPTGSLDLIFCRNVLIYFNQTNRKFVVDRFYDLLSKDGTLILGSSEMLGRDHDKKFEPHQHSQTLYYRKK